MIACITVLINLGKRIIGKGRPKWWRIVSTMELSLYEVHRVTKSKH